MERRSIASTTRGLAVCASLAFASFACGNVESTPSQDGGEYALDASRDASQQPGVDGSPGGAAPDAGAKAGDDSSSSIPADASTGNSADASVGSGDGGSSSIQADGSVDAATGSGDAGPSQGQADASPDGPIVGPGANGAAYGLTYNVVAADYATALDRIVLVSDTDDALHLLDTRIGMDVSVKLPTVPTSVSVGGDGMHAAVGHNGFVSYVDLKALSVTATWPISASIGGVTLANNGYVYAFPVPSNAGQSLHAVNLTTGVDTVGGGTFLFQGVVTAGDTALIASEDGEPGQLIRYDLKQPSAPNATYQEFGSPEPICGYTWLSRDSYRVYTGCGTMFYTSDLAFAGLLPTSSGQVAGVDDRSSNGTIAMLANTPSVSNLTMPPNGATELWTVDARSLALLEKDSLPVISVAGVDEVTDGRYVFHDSAGSQVFVVVHASVPTTTVAVNVWGIATFNAVNLPGSATTDAGSAEAGSVGNAADGGGVSVGIPYRVVDAKYSIGLDRMVIATDVGNSLHLLDGTSGNDVSIALPDVPHGVSLDPAGTHAVALHTNAVSYVDLSARSVVEQFSIAPSASTSTSQPIVIDDAALGGNGFLYLFDGGTGVDLKSIHAIDLATGVDTPSNSLYEWKGVVGGSALFVIMSGSPTWLQRFDITAGAQPTQTAEVFSNTYSVCGKPWVGRNGSRLFMGCGAVANASDLSYLSAFASLSTIVGVDDGAADGTIAVLGTSPSPATTTPALANALALYGGQYFDPKGTIPLPPLPAYGTPAPSDGRFVFHDAAGTHTFVILHASAPGSTQDVFGYAMF